MQDLLRLLSGPRIAWIAIAIAMAAVPLTGCGGDDENKPKIRANETDMAFATEMLEHHERGIDAAELARTRATSREVRASARDLIQLQSSEAQVLRANQRTLAAGGIEQGDLGSPQSSLDLARLRQAEDFDAAYVAAMIPHHAAAIRMSAAEQRGGIHEGLRSMTGDISDLARFQIRQLRRAGQ